ncbi:endochitinase A-like [Pistacia vera]|uniref:endochitinase A-like n=1 Tax=Pistacia vera TaxID=55513 RepID=UPI001263770E|nr:endochitinase A-like [Pistacia vera]
MSQNVASIVTPGFFDGIKNQAAASCAGKSFYTRDGFLKAASSFPKFGSGSAVESKREIAFFAHTYATLKKLTIQMPTVTINKQYPCVAGKKYYGRGPMQLTWNSNSELAEKLCLLQAALWFWMNNVHSVMNQGFGATQKINGALECGGKQPDKVNARIGYYRDYCKKFVCDPGQNLSC